MDKIDKATRSRLMSRIRSANTGLEENFRRLLRKAGIRGYVRSPNNIIGRPDFVFRRHRLAVFLDSCFWHGCSRHLRMPRSRLSYWNKKIALNRRRDRRQSRLLRGLGWCVLRVWEHELKTPAKVLAKISEKLRRQAELKETLGASRNENTSQGHRTSIVGGGPSTKWNAHKGRRR